jgi:hypothetical protein
MLVVPILEALLFLNFDSPKNKDNNDNKADKEEKSFKSHYKFSYSLHFI